MVEVPNDGRGRVSEGRWGVKEVEVEVEVAVAIARQSPWEVFPYYRSTYSRTDRSTDGAVQCCTLRTSGGRGDGGGFVC